ncbi:uncharacterized protein LOC144882816 [Branchiostoma floridae x Branchiostoma japonicum]
MTSLQDITPSADKCHDDDGDDDIIFLAVVTTQNTDNAPPQDEMPQKKVMTPSLKELAPPPDKPPQRKERTPSVVVLGTPQKSRCVSSAGSPDPNGLIVTYSRPADTVNFPHPRSACPHHPFSTADSILRGPYMQNETCCDKCYCYVCDKPAKECGLWGACWRAHCNAHRKNTAWQRVRKVYNNLYCNS